MITDSEFARFRDGMGGHLVERIWSLDISELCSWREFHHQVINFNLDSDGGFFQRAREAECWLSCGERTIMLAIVAAAGFSNLAEELNGGCTFDISRDSSPRHREAFQLAMAAAAISG